jgi:hypothetical protein
MMIEESTSIRFAFLCLQVRRLMRKVQLKFLSETAADFEARKQKEWSVPLPGK